MENTKEKKGTENKPVAEKEFNKQEKQGEQKQMKTRAEWANAKGVEFPLAEGLLSALATDEQERKVLVATFEQEMEKFLGGHLDTPA